MQFSLATEMSLVRMKIPVSGQLLLIDSFNAIFFLKKKERKYGCTDSSILVALSQTPTKNTKWIQRKC